VTHAVLPYLRQQGSGHLLQVSSLSGVVAFPMMGLYQASKWALEGMSETLAAEVAGFGIHVTIIEPGAYRTDFAGPSSQHTRADPAYDAMRASQEGHARGYHSGHPKSSADLLFEVVDAAEPPLRLMMGRSAWPSRRRSMPREPPSGKRGPIAATPPADRTDLHRSRRGAIRVATLCRQHVKSGPEPREQARLLA